MSKVNLSGSDLRDANLTLVLMDADLRGANLEGIKYDPLTLQFLASADLEGARIGADLRKALDRQRTADGISPS